MLIFYISLQWWLSGNPFYSLLSSTSVFLGQKIKVSDIKLFFGSSRKREVALILYFSQTDRVIEAFLVYLLGFIDSPASEGMFYFNRAVSWKRSKGSWLKCYLIQMFWVCARTAYEFLSYHLLFKMFLRSILQCVLSVSRRFQWVYIKTAKVFHCKTTSDQQQVDKEPQWDLTDKRGRVLQMFFN